MLEAIKILGEYETAREGLDDIEVFVEKSKLKNTKKVICTVFKKGKKFTVYDHTHIEDYDPSKSGGYLYKTTQHRRYDVTPTAKIKKITKGKGKEKTVDIKSVVESTKKRLFLWFSTYVDKDPLISSLKNELDNKEKQKKILDDFADNYKKLRVYKDDKGRIIDEQANSIFTIKIIKNGEEKYLGDFKIFRDILEEEGERKFYYRKSFGESESKGNGFCCVCKTSGEVFGFALPFPFYTVDKRGFAPEFKRMDSWKRLPICKECAKHLTISRDFLDTYLLKKRFYHGYQFYVIPHFILGEIDEELIKEIKRYKGKEEYHEGLLYVEDGDILEPLKEREGILNLIFMFIEPKQGGMNIARYIEDVPPSWIKKLSSTLKDINSLPLFKEESLKRVGIIGKKKGGDLKNIDYSGTRLGGLVATFFPRSKETGIYRKYFIDTIGDILANRSINKDFLLNAFMREIRNAHVKANKDKKYLWNERILTLKSLMLLLFLNKLNLIRGEKMKKEEVNSGNVKEFLDTYEEAFDAPDKKAVFLEGVLTKFLLDVQYANRKSTPFRAKLHGLKLDEIKIKKLLPEIIEKLREYKVGYLQLEELTSKYLVEADNNGWDLSKDEVSYYFALGLNLGGLFKEKKDDDNGGKKNE